MDQTQLAPEQPPKNATPPCGTRSPRRRRIAFQVAAVALTLVSALAGTGLARWLRAPDVGDDQPIAKAPRFPNRLFADWSKPDLVVILTAQQKGYLLPCGCSRPQIGGLERRYNFLQQIKAAGWPYVAVDLGDTPQRHGPAGLPNQQGLIKYFYSMLALDKMGYSAVTFGEYEVNLGLGTVLAEYHLNYPTPALVASNLLDADKHYPMQTKQWQLVVANPSGIRVGVTGVVGANTVMKIKELTHGDKKVRFENTPAALNRVLTQMQKEKVDIPVLLYQGPVTRNAMKRPPTEAVACAEAFPQFPIVLCLSEEDEPPAKPVEIVTKTGSVTRVITLGRKGKFIGAVGVYKTGLVNRPYMFRYERAEMTEDFLTPKAEEKNHPIAALMELYTKDLRDKNYLEKYGQVRHLLQVMPEVPNLRKPGKVEYVGGSERTPDGSVQSGSARCKKCHEEAYDIWKKTPHSHAYQTLVDAKRPGNRQYDPECIVCHTVGFGIQSGYVNEKRTTHLKNVGCESCHGPAGMHVANPTNREWQKRINPWKYLPANKRKDAMDQACQKCHDIDNDVTWIHGGFEKKWPKVKHYTPQPGE